MVPGGSVLVTGPKSAVITDDTQLPPTSGPVQADALTEFVAGCAVRLETVLVVPVGCGQVADGYVADAPLAKVPQL